MSNYAGSVPHDPEVERMRAARNHATVLKTKLMGFRSLDSTSFVFVFEGPDDPLVYIQWVRRLKPHLNYEPFTCNGKGKLLEFMAMMDRDANGLGGNILYFIDTDFDGSRGYSSDKLFITDKYSVENYLVESRVIDETLKCEYHCALEPDIRAMIIEVFEQCYSLFLHHTHELNARIYAARTLGIKLNKPLPARIGPFASVGLCCVMPGTLTAKEVVVLEREPTPDETIAVDVILHSFDPRAAYRGKFAMMFFLKWFDALSLEYKNPDSELFKGLDRKHKPRNEEIGLGNFASKSCIPNGLSLFLNKAA